RSNQSVCTTLSQNQTERCIFASVIMGLSFEQIALLRMKPFLQQKVEGEMISTRRKQHLLGGTPLWLMGLSTKSRFPRRWQHLLTQQRPIVICRDILSANRSGFI